MAKFFIDRPVFAIVLSLLIVLSGALAGFNLPIAQYPQIQPPTVSVSTMYVGANADTINQAVAQAIEEQVNGVEGMDYMTSTSDNSGRYDLQVIFNLGTDGDIASVKVQNNISQANASLPAEVKEYGVVTKKASDDMALIFSLYSPEGSHDRAFLYNYMKVYMLDGLKRVRGVGDVNIFGSDMARRIWLNPDRLAELGLTVNDVIAAVREQNVQAPAGTVGGPPVNSAQEFQYTGNIQGRLAGTEEFGGIIIKAQPNGAFIRVKDVARVESSERMMNISSRLNGANAVGMGVMLTSDANAMDTIGEVRAVIEDAAKDFPPDMKYTTIFDTTAYISESIGEVVKTFFEALLLVTVIVYLFLQSWRATLIPLLAVPVSLIGTFGSFIILGFTINTLTLFAMVLAIGLVVDDAIVVIEAVEHHIRDNKLGPYEATRRAMSEVSGPVVAIAFVLASVFIPVAFLGGMMGVLYRQFALTIAVSMALSALVALSLTPALCAMLLRPHNKAGDRQSAAKRFFERFNDWFYRMTESYGNILTSLINKAKYVFISLLLLLACSAILFREVPTTFIPDEDQSFLIAAVSLPEGASLNRTQAVLTRLSEDFRKVPGVADVMSVTGYDALSSSAKASAGVNFIQLDDWNGRKDAKTQIESILGGMYDKAGAYAEASVIAMNPPSLPGLGMVGGFTMVLQDLAGRDDQELGGIINAFLAAANTQCPEVTGVYTTYRSNSPVIQFEVDREKVKTLGLSLSDVFNALQVNFGGYEINDFNIFGRTYKVITQADAKYRTEADNMRFIYVRGPGGMVPLDTLLKPHIDTSAPSITRFNATRGIQINGTAAAGYSSGQAIAAMEQLANNSLPAGFKVEWSGQSREEKKSGDSATRVMALALVFVFLCLAALYESWAIPYAVLLSVPTGIFGAFFSQYIAGLQNSVYMQIGIITLIGLAAKNAILIVEFAKIRTDDGEDPVKAAIVAAKLRLRPILMTSLAFIIGCLPLAIAAGAGAGARNAMGVTVVGGMTIATGLGIFLIPVLFVLVEWSREKLRFGKNNDEENYPGQS